jgi:hypothetical protein
LWSFDESDGFGNYSLMVGIWDRDGFRWNPFLENSFDISPWIYVPGPLISSVMKFKMADHGEIEKTPPQLRNPPDL